MRDLSFDHGDERRSMPYQVFGAFHNAMHSHRQLLGRRLGERGAHPGQALCLREIAFNDGITQRDLAERVGLARPTVTVMLQKLEASGYIERRTDEEDSRFTRIFLTPEGLKLLRKMREAMDAVVADMVGQLPEPDQQELVRLLGKLDENMTTALGAETNTAQKEIS